MTSAPDDSVESIGTFVTRNQLTDIVGTASNDALIMIDADNDGEYDDGSARADEFGQYSVGVSLEPGETTIRVRAVDDTGTERVTEVDVHYSVGSVAAFETSLGTFHIELLDDDAPLTVANYQQYFDAYENAFVHRSINNFVIQGGGFEFVDGQIAPIDTNPPVQNEFNENNPNVRGTLSTALSAGNIHSATNQWFINLVDNDHLNDARHTVFARVIGDGMDIVDAIAAVEVFNLDGGVFSTTPLRDFSLFSRELTGSVELTQGSTLLTGTDTLFTEELSVGSRVRLLSDGEVIGDYTVNGIVSDTELVLTVPAIENHSDLEARTHVSISDQHITFGDLDEVLGE